MPLTNKCKFIHLLSHTNWRKYEKIIKVIFMLSHLKITENVVLNKKTIYLSSVIEKC